MKIRQKNGKKAPKKDFRAGLSLVNMSVPLELGHQSD